MSTYDPDSVPCGCGHMRGIHKAAAPNQCATNGCGCGGFRARKPGAPASPEPPRVIQGRVERELPPAGRPAPATVARTELAICPPCEIDRCDTCLGDGCACACIDSAPAVIKAAAAPEPEPPGRCEVCGYLVTAPGCQASCGTPDAARVNRLASSIGRGR